MANQTIQQPQSQAGIIGVSANTNMGGWKFNPRSVVLFSIIFIVVVKILDYLVAHPR